MRLVGWSRLTAFAVETIVMTVLASLGHLLRPFSPRAAAWWATRCCRVWCRLGCACLNVRRDIRGPIPRGVFVAASNHLSYLDILVLGSLWPGVFLAKREIAAWPLVGMAASVAGTIFIDRDAPREIVQAGHEMADALGRGMPVTLFPEGQITHGEQVLPFQPALLAAAARRRVPCHAVSVRYEANEPDIDPGTQICWPTSTPVLPHALRVATMRDLTAVVEIAAEPVVSSDRRELASSLHGWVASRFRPMRTAEDILPSCAR